MLKKSYFTKSLIHKVQPAMPEHLFLMSVPFVLSFHHIETETESLKQRVQQI